MSPPKRNRPPKLRELTSEEEADLKRTIAGVEGDKLQAALEKLGRAVLAKTR